MTIRGGGNPMLDMACAPRFRMGPPPWGFAADDDCIMVQVETEPTEYKFVARWSRFDGELPSDCLAPTAGAFRDRRPLHDIRTLGLTLTDPIQVQRQY
jgi:hypothetical protein